MLLVTAALAGCLGSDPAPNEPRPSPPEEGERDPASPADGAVAAPEGNASVPAACDRGGPGMAHHAGGVAVSRPDRPVPCSSRTGAGSFEPTMGVASDGTLFLYPASGTGGVPPVVDDIGVARSSDGGALWERLVPSVQGQPTHVHSADPYLYLDPATDRLFADDLHPPYTCSVLSISDDLGQTWTHVPGGCMETDHQSIFAGPPVVSETVDYPNVVYRCAANGGVGVNQHATQVATCQRSIDGGLTWLPPGAPAFAPNPEGTGHDSVPGSCDGLTGHGVAGPDGTVYLPKGWCGQPWLAISGDEALTWSRVQVADNGMATFGKLQDHEVAVAVDEAGTLYAAWVAADRLPYLAVSTDGGTQWSEPLMVGPPGLREARWPSIAPGGPGAVAISYLGSTNTPEATSGDGAPGDCLGDPQTCVFPGEPEAYANATWNGYITISYDVLQPDPLFWSGSVNPPSEPLAVGICYPWQCSGDGSDFHDVVVGPDGRAWASFVDACTDQTCPMEGFAGQAEGLAGWLWGLPSLWGSGDPNGPYPDDAAVLSTVGFVST